MPQGVLLKVFRVQTPPAPAQYMVEVDGDGRKGSRPSAESLWSEIHRHLGPLLLLLSYLKNSGCDKAFPCLSITIRRQYNDKRAEEIHFTRASRDSSDKNYVSLARLGNDDATDNLQ